MAAFSLDHESGLSISAVLSESDVTSAISAEDGLKVRNLKNGWVWYTLPPMKVEALKAAVSLAFENGRLKIIQLAHIDASLYGNGWSDWDESKEKLRAKNTEKMIQALGFSIGNFSWGSIWCGYDAKSGSSNGIITFET